MTPKALKLTGLATALALCVGVGPALAQQEGAIDPGVYSIEFVHPWFPFDTPHLNVDEIALEAIPMIAGDWTDGQLLEVRQRCSTIVMDPNRDAAVVLMPGIPFPEAGPAFCSAVFAWAAENRPDSPDTYEELAAMGGKYDHS